VGKEPVHLRKSLTLVSKLTSFKAKLHQNVVHISLLFEMFRQGDFGQFKRSENDQISTYPHSLHELIYFEKYEDARCLNQLFVSINFSQTIGLMVGVFAFRVFSLLLASRC